MKVLRDSSLVPLFSPDTEFRSQSGSNHNFPSDRRSSGASVSTKMPKEKNKNTKQVSQVLKDSKETKVGVYEDSLNDNVPDGSI